MVRKLAMAVSLAVSSTLPLSVYALGLGEIRTSSALNENFKGEIELLSVEKGELDTLKVGLAPAEVFARTGVERPFHLSRLRFKTLRKRDGRAVILVTSEVPIREPFLDFFVQVTWPKGKLVREYTVLLDPPVTTGRRAPKVERAASGGGAVRQAEAPAATAAVPGGEYGPVRRNETLWQIADRIRPAGITVHQMMVALYRANPEAFLNGNINLLKKGRVLRVPEINEIERIGRREAVAEFRQLAEGWTPAVAAKAEKAESEVEGAAAPGETAAQPSGDTSEEGRLRIAGVEQAPAQETGAAESGVSGEDDVQALKQKLLLVEEQAATARQESEDLRERMSALEQQLEDMKRLLELRDQELAQLQAQAAAAAGTESEPPSAEAEAPEAGGQEAAPVVEEAPSPAEAEPAAPVVAEEIMPPAPAGGETEAPAPEPAPEAAKPAAEPVPAPQAVPFWRQWLTDNWQLAAGGGAALLLLLGLLAARRKKEPEDQELPPSATVSQGGAKEEQESILEDESASAVAAASADSAIGDTSFLSEYSTEELRALHEDTTEVDPVSEADVYIAYGRYSQAEEILREAMKNGDTSAAVRHKMLEVYYATQKKDEFRKLAEEMVADGQDKEDPEAWEHIQTMGRDLDRANPLFAAAAAAGAVSVDSGLEEQDSDLSLDLSTLAEEVDSQLNPDSESLETFSNMDLELPSLQIEPEVPDESAEEVAKADDLSLNLNETELHTELGDLSELGDLGVDATTLDETLADLTGDLEGVMADSRILDQPVDLEQSTLSELEGLSGSEPVEEPQAEAPAEAREEQKEDSTIGDEVETKLELAKAFMEIGDADGARSILQEVQEDGTPQQKEAAAELLSQLDG